MGLVLDGLLQDPLCKYSGNGTGPVVITWLRFPCWGNGLIWGWVQELKEAHPDLLAGSVFDIPDGLPPIGSFSNGGSMQDYMAMQESSYSIITYDLSGVSAVSTWDTVTSWGDAPENVCIDGNDPRGLMHPRSFLLMLYRADALVQLHAAGRTASASPPDDWEELIALLAAHEAAVAQGAQQTDTAADALPKYGLCITTHADCGRLGDVWAAIAASVVQTAGTTQGVYWDLTVAPPAAPLLVNSSGWQYATDVLRRLLRYNAPDFDDGNGGVAAQGNATSSSSKMCTDITPLFTNGSCMITMEWDVLFSSLGSIPGLSVAPLPGSRLVMDRSSTSATAGKLVNCTWELCAASANHDLLYLNTSVAALRMDPLAPESLVQVDGNTTRTCDFRAVLQIEAAAVEQLGGSFNDSWVPVNRAPYSVVPAIYAWYSDDALDSGHKYLTAVVGDIAARLSTQSKLRTASTVAARSLVGYNATDILSGDPVHFVRTRWWTALAQPFQVQEYLDRNISAEAAQAFMRTIWHALHSPNGATQASSPDYVNFGKWALSNVALTVQPLNASSTSSAVGSLHGIFRMINQAFSSALVRQAYEEATGSVWVDPASPPRGPTKPSKNAISQTLVPLLVGLLVGLGVLVLALAFVLLRMRRRQRDFLGRVRAPRVGPDTSLLVSDVQNSTRLWEELSVSTMDSALKIHHSTIRKVMAQYDGYESATEGDSFLIAFGTPSRALAFASACQLALLQQDWPAELLEHPDGAVVTIDPRDANFRITGACAAAKSLGRAPGKWRPFCVAIDAWQAMRHRSSIGGLDTQRSSSAGALSPAHSRTSLGDQFSHPEHEDSMSLTHPHNDSGGEGKDAGSPFTAVTLEAGNSGIMNDSLPDGFASQTTASEDRFSHASKAGLGGSGFWWPGASSTWGKALAAAFPVAATQTGITEAVVLRTCKAVGGCHSDKKGTAYRGLRIRMGIHTGLDDPQHMVFNKVGSAFKYYGPFAETAKLVGDAAPGGLITLSGAAFARLRNASAASRGGTSRDTVIAYAGHYVLSDAPAAPKVAAAANATSPGAIGSQHVKVQIGPDNSAAAEEVPLFLAVPSVLVSRLAHSAPLRGVRMTQLGSLAAPTGTIAIAFMKVVGASTLLADLPGPASRALEQFQRLAGGLLGKAGGYLVEGGDGLMLAAFGSPLAGVEWALDCVAGLRELDWEEELLAHELCEEVVTVGGIMGASTPAVPAAGAALSGRPSRLSHQSMIGSHGQVAGHLVQDTPTQLEDTGLSESPQSQTTGDGVAGNLRPQHSRRQVPPLPPTKNLRVLTAPRRAHERGLRIKVGLDVGAVTYSLTEASGRLSYRGKVMNRAARIAGTAAAGQVLCSGAVWLACEAGMALGPCGGVVGVSLGRIALKGISAPVEVVQCSRG